MKKIIASLIIMLFVSGCWNYHELNNYSIVTGIAIDKNEKGYEASVLIANSPKETANKEADSSRIVVYSGVGDSIFTAIKDIGLISAKELYLGHFSVLIISEDVARDGINDVIDLFLRESNSKKNFYVAISKDCKAKDTLKIITPLSNFPSQSIADNLKSTSQLQGTVSNVNFNELLENLKRNGIDNAINMISIIGNIEDGSNKENVEKSEPSTYIKLGPLGLFKGDKLVHWTTKEESVGINIARNRAKELYVNIKYKKADIIVETTDINTKVKANIINNKPSIDIYVSGEAKLVEVKNNINLKKDDTINLITTLMNKKIINYVNEGINTAIKYKSDALGFGLLFYQNYPKYYENNKNILNDNLNVNIHSNVIIKTKGSSQNSLEDKYD